MTVTADNKKRVVLPGAKAGDVFEFHHQGAAHFLLVKLSRPKKPKARVRREGRLLVLSRSRAITMTETRKAMDEFP